MRSTKCWCLSLLIFSFGVTCYARLAIKGNKFYLGSQHVFLSGGNLPWIQYGHDYGNGQWMKVKNQIHDQMKLLHMAGGNSMRLWVHVQGESSPVFNSEGFVVQLDHSGTFISDFRDMLDLAKSFDILIFPTLWNAAVDGNNHHEGLTGLIQNTSKLNSYITNALIPLVSQVKGHPALGGWDIINEPEGFINPFKTGSSHCFDSYTLGIINIGWARWQLDLGYREMLRFINWQAAAIKSVDPMALVTVGIWMARACTDRFGFFNHYSDECLILAGNKTLGTLDFYEIHSYAFLGLCYDKYSPFRHYAHEYNISKPLLVGEFLQQSIPIKKMFHHVYTHNYSGAWSWDLGTYGTNQRQGINSIRNLTGNGIIPIHL